MVKKGVLNNNSDLDILKKRVGIAFIILIIGLGLYSGFIFLFKSSVCSDNQCFVDAMNNCKRVSWIRDDAQASWVYEIKGNEKKDSCEINVRLLKMKQGTIDSERLEGKEMKCIVQKTETQFPEKDISVCSGVLKEELQDIIIQRMHNYLLENLGDIKEEFQGV